MYIHTTHTTHYTTVWVPGTYLVNIGHTSTTHLYDKWQETCACIGSETSATPKCNENLNNMFQMCRKYNTCRQRFPLQRGVALFYHNFYMKQVREWSLIYFFLLLNYCANFVWKIILPWPYFSHKIISTICKIILRLTLYSAT